jgi:sec-independent protein translocase protein TatA
MKISTTELFIILIILIFLFGGKKIPEFVRGISQALREYRKASTQKNIRNEKKE